MPDPIRHPSAVDSALDSAIKSRNDGVRTPAMPESLPQCRSRCRTAGVVAAMPDRPVMPDLIRHPVAKFHRYGADGNEGGDSLRPALRPCLTMRLVSARLKGISKNSVRFFEMLRKSILDLQFLKINL
jgi:hypothetical protein